MQHLQIDTSGEPWGAFTAVRQTLSDNSALVGMSILQDPRKDNATAEEEGAEILTLDFCSVVIHFVPHITLIFQAYNHLSLSWSPFLYVCVTCELHHRSPVIPISYSCLALLPNLPDLPQINLSAVIKSYLVLSPTFTLTYTRRLADTHTYTSVSTFHAGLFLSLVDF